MFFKLLVSFFVLKRCTRVPDLVVTTKWTTTGSTEEANGIFMFQSPGGSLSPPALSERRFR